MSNSVYQIITNEIIRKLEEDEVAPWQKPWNGAGSPKNFFSMMEYRGINTILLGMQDYECPYWGTFKQISNSAGQIRKGEKSTMVVFWKFIEKKDKETGEIESYPLMRYYKIFNLEQQDGIPWKTVMAYDEENAEEIDPIEACEYIVDHFKDAPEIKHVGNRACYIPSTDTVRLPAMNDFKSSAGYYFTTFHELAHSTGNISRLNRSTITDHNPFGSNEYSKEELIAEISASFLCNITGIENETIDNSTSYIQSWLRALKRDVTMVVKAAGQAQKAVDYIVGKQGE